MTWNKYPDTNPGLAGASLTIDKYGIMRVCTMRAKQWFIFGFMPMSMSTKVNDVTHWMPLPEPPNE